MTAYVSNDIFGPDGGVGEVGQGVNWFTISPIEPLLRIIDTSVITESPTLLDGMYDYFEDCPNSSGEDQCQDHMFVLDVGRVEQSSGRLTISKIMLQLQEVFGRVPMVFFGRGNKISLFQPKLLRHLQSLIHIVIFGVSS
eukprot:UN26920